jgi:hypothetical protein
LGERIYTEERLVDSNLYAFSYEKVGERLKLGKYCRYIEVRRIDAFCSAIDGATALERRDAPQAPTSNSS